MSLKNILLVEGEADRSFFEALCKSLQLAVEVKVSTPRDTGQFKNTKQAALAAVQNTYLSQLQDGQTERLAIVIDADQVADGGGFANMLARLNALFGPAGYAAPSISGPGLVFAHTDGLHSIGAWVMPDNASDGMLEDWVQSSLHPNEAALMQHAKQSIDQIPGGPKFKVLRRTKAEVATWLAWQDDPDHGLWQAVKPGLLDESAPQFQAMKAWLEKVFPAP